MKNKAISVVIPVFNEEDNIRPCYNEIKRTLDKLAKNSTLSSYEVVFVNDGSSDNTQQNLEQLKKSEGSKLKIIKFRRNFGQTAALKAGFELAGGDLIVTMDGDMQNDPSDIPKLIEELEKGYDVVSGWRHDRKDAFSKKFFSKVINMLRRKIIGDELHDYGCSLKIYKKECVKDLELYGELHRYITAYLHIKGYKIGEIKVNHRHRKSGVTKYKFNRGINGVLDLLFLQFWSSYSDRPLHLFGRLGIYQIIIAFFIAIEQIIKSVIVRELRFGPLLALASMLVITGLLFVIFGFLFELISRNYFRSNYSYSVEKTIY